MPNTITVTRYERIEGNLDWEGRIKAAHRSMLEKSVPAILEFAKEVAAFKADCAVKPGTPGTYFSEKVQVWLGMPE